MDVTTMPEIRVLAKQQTGRLDIQLEDNNLVPLLYGEHDAHLKSIEKLLNVEIASRGNQISITGPETKLESAKSAISALWERLLNDLPVGKAEVEAAVRIADSKLDKSTRKLAMEAFRAPVPQVKTQKCPISPRSPTQAAYLQAIGQHELVFGLGPAGTGKTYLAVAQAVAMLQAGDVDRLILCRPAVEAGEKLGFLPGDLQEKVNPFLRPMYDALHDMIPSEQVIKLLAQGDIEVAPLAFMRGRTLSNSFVILDEAQNTTPEQMKMALTRLGENSRMVVTGDPSQTDLPSNIKSGLRDAKEVLQTIKDVAFIQFTAADVVRHPLVSKIVAAYDKRDSDKNNKD